MTGTERGSARRSAPLQWKLARVLQNAPEAEGARTLTLELPEWAGHRAGQHVDVRLTAEDGYQAQRSYSLASPPGAPQLQLTVDHLPDGEVSPYLVDVLAAGDLLELRGPIGGYFTWEAQQGGPLLLVAGGSGVVPLMCMLRHRATSGSRAPARLLYSARTLGDVFYREELARLASDGTGLDVQLTLTRRAPAGWQGLARRVDAAMLEQVSFAPAERPHVFVCGPTPFVEAVADLLTRLGHSRERVKTERFGQGGGRP
jgi:ferredoxin-NADP reductase